MEDNASVEQDGHTSQLYVAFCCLWAIATLFHVASTVDRWNGSPYPILVAVAAVWLLLDPSSIARLALLALLQLLEVVVRAPGVSNHWLLAAFVNLSILCSLLAIILENRRLRVNRSDLYRTFAPVVRIELVVLYFFVVLHKLNADYFSPETSCAVAFYLEQANRYPFLPTSSLFQFLAIYGTVAIEAAIPVLLVIPRTRTLGILVGGVFHFVVALNPISQFYNFSAVLFALFVLFVPPHLLSELRERWQAWDAQNRVQAWLPANPRVAIRYGALGIAGIVVLVVATQGYDVQRAVVLRMWTLYATGLIVLLSWLTLHRQRSVPPRQPSLAHRHVGLLLIPALLFLNGASPYLGLKTETSFAMFSNLRTEGDRSNHLLIPTSVQPFDYQRELVAVTESSDEYLRRVAARGHRIPLFAVQARLTARPEASVSYVYDGKEVHVVPRAADSSAVQPIPLLLRKWLDFRTVPRTDVEYCQH